MNTELNVRRPTGVTPTKPQAQPSKPSIAWFRPAVDVLEGPDSLVLVLDVPGVAPSAFEVKAENRSLLISGVRADGERGWRREFAVPGTVDAQQITAKAENGVLVVTLPKAEAAKPRKIQVS